MGISLSSTLFSAVRSARMIAADRENAEAAQEVEIAGTVAVEQVLTLPFLKSDVVSNRLQDPNQLLVQVLGVHGTPLRLAVHKHLGNV